MKTFMPTDTEFYDVGGPGDGLRVEVEFHDREDGFGRRITVYNAATIDVLATGDVTWNYGGLAVVKYGGRVWAHLTDSFYPNGVFEMVALEQTGGATDLDKDPL
jgi:hypothetical protein